MKKMMALLIALALLCPTIPAQDAQGPLGENAALKYWQTFALLPTLSEAEETILGDCVTAPMDDRTIAVVKQGAQVVEMLRRAAQTKACNWGLIEAGPATVMPHMSKARQMVRWAVLHARYEVSRGRHSEAVDDLLAGMTLSRHCSAGGTLISGLVSIATERVLANAAAGELKQMNEAARRKLLAALDALPPVTSIQDIIENERRVNIQWLADELRRGGVPIAESFLHTMKQLQVPLPWNPEGDVTQATVDQMIKDLERVSQLYRELGRVLALPAEEFERERPALTQKLKESPLATFFVPPLERTREEYMAEAAHRALLKAAITATLDGPEKIATVPLPAGAEPLEYQMREDGGFVLQSQALLHGKPVSITVKGARAATKP